MCIKINDISFDKEPYEYFLYTYGGFYNSEFQKKHGFIKGTHWFESEEDRQAYIHKLNKLTISTLNYNLFMTKDEGRHTRYRTILTVVMEHGEALYEYKHAYEYFFDSERLKNTWFKGECSCDCTRSLLIKQSNPEFSKLKCGDKIKVKEFIIDFERI